MSRAVIGLNLCPFAKAVQAKQQIRYAVSGARTPDTLLADLQRELLLLSAVDSAHCADSANTDHSAGAAEATDQSDPGDDLDATARCDAIGGIDTTLLIVPHALGSFSAFNDFLILADHLLAACRLVGRLQIASFHPDYRFAGSEPDDIENFSNRAPYPILHLLRESSVERAVAAYPATDEIVERNQRTLRALGHAGWRRLMESADPAAAQTPGTP